MYGISVVYVCWCACALADLWPQAMAAHACMASPLTLIMFHHPLPAAASSSAHTERHTSHMFVTRHTCSLCEPCTCSAPLLSVSCRSHTGGSPARVEAARAIVEAGVAVMGHVGLTPQSVSVLGEPVQVCLGQRRDILCVSMRGRTAKHHAVAEPLLVSHGVHSGGKPSLMTVQLSWPSSVCL